MELAEAFVSIRPHADPSTFARDAERQMRGPLGTAADRASRDTKVRPGVDGRGFASDLATHVSRPAASAAAQMRGLFARVGVGLAIRQSITEVREAQRAARQTETLLKTTGEAANVTEADIARLTGTLQDYAAVDDDIIRGGANVLLTFKGIRNEVGEGNRIFDRAIETALDMAAVFGGDLQSSIVQVGKALENPKQGLSALRRIGVTFTEEQQKQVKALQEQGRLLEAQVIILAAIEGQVGGAAGAAADDVQRANVRIRNSMEQLGAAILPPAGVIAQGVSKLGEVFTALPAPIQVAAVAGVGIGLIAGPAVSAARAVGGLGAAFLRAITPAATLTTVTAAEGVAAGHAAKANAANALAINAETAAAGRATAALTLLRGALLARVGAGGLIATLGQAAVAAAAGYAAFKLTTFGLEKLVDKAPEVDALTASLNIFAVTGENVTGLDFGKLAHDLDMVAGHQSRWARLGRAVTSGDPLNLQLKATQEELKALDAALAEMTSTGNAAGAAAALARFNDILLTGGKTLADVIPFLPRYSDALQKTRADAKAATGWTDGLTFAYRRQKDALERLENTFTRRVDITTSQFDLADATEAVADAERTLADVRADAAGWGPKSLAALKAEADARDGVTDALESQADAQEALTDARRDLADFESGTSALIRALEREQLEGRVVTTPDEAIGKDIDLLTFDQNTAEEHARLREGVADAEEGVRDAKEHTADAERALTDAAKDRRQVSVDAAKDIAAAERDVQSAIIGAAEAAKTHAEATAKTNDEYSRARAGAAAYIETLEFLRQGVEDGSPLAVALDALIQRLVRLGVILPDASVPTQAGRPSGMLDEAAFRARGGPLGEGLTWVGEAGPELARKRGSHVQIHSALESTRMLERTRAEGRDRPDNVTHLEVARLARSVEALARHGTTSRIDAPITQNVYAHDMPTRDAMEITNRHLAWELALLGRRSTI